MTVSAFSVTFHRALKPKHIIFADEPWAMWKYRDHNKQKVVKGFGDDGEIEL